MAIRSGLFDSTEIIETDDGYPRGNKAESADFFARYFAAFIGNGVYAQPSDGFQLFAYDGLTVRVAAGSAFINGYFAFDDADGFITLTSAVTQTVFRVVLRLDTNFGTVALALLEDDTDLTRTGGIYELALADITVGASALSVRQSDIRDLRADGDLCGFVTGTIEQLDTSTFASQLDGVIDDAAEAYDGMTEYIEIAESEFDEWFAAIRDQLSTDAAGHLEENKAEIDFSNVADGALPSRVIAGKAVTTSKLGDNAVTGVKISSYSVTTSKLGDNAVTAVKLCSNAVTTAKISDGAVTTAKLADDCITSEKLGADIKASLALLNELRYGIKFI